MSIFKVDEVTELSNDILRRSFQIFFSTKTFFKIVLYLYVNGDFWIGNFMSPCRISIEDFYFQNITHQFYQV